jgi:hypothetical protein
VSARLADLYVPFAECPGVHDHREGRNNLENSFIWFAMMQPGQTLLRSAGSTAETRPFSGSSAINKNIEIRRHRILDIYPTYSLTLSYSSRNSGFARELA